MPVTVIIDKKKERDIINGTLINAHEQGQVLFVYDKNEKIVSIFKEWIGAVIESKEDDQVS